MMPLQTLLSLFLVFFAGTTAVASEQNLQPASEAVSPQELATIFSRKMFKITHGCLSFSNYTKVMLYEIAQASENGKSEAAQSYAHFLELELYESQVYCGDQALDEDFINPDSLKGYASAGVRG